MSNLNYFDDNPNKKEAAYALAIEESRFRIACTNMLREYNAEQIQREGRDENSNDVMFHLSGEPLSGTQFYMLWRSANPITAEESLLVITQSASELLKPSWSLLQLNERPGELLAINYKNLSPDDAEELATINDWRAYEGKARLEDLWLAREIMSRANEIDETVAIEVDRLGTLPVDKQVKLFLGAMANYEDEQQEHSDAAGQG